MQANGSGLLWRGLEKPALHRVGATGPSLKLQRKTMVGLDEEAEPMDYCCWNAIWDSINPRWVRWMREV